MNSNVTLRLNQVLPANLTHAFFNVETFDETDLTLLGPDGGWVFGRHNDFYGEPICYTMTAKYPVKL